MTNSQPRFLRPSGFERFINRIMGMLVGWGLGLSHNYLLQVRGRRTGRIYSTPVNIVDHRGKRFLVAPRGEAQWVRNARASGEVWLKKGATRLHYAVRPLANQEKPEILREYLSRYKATVQRYFSVAPGATDEAFTAISPDYPVFELLQKEP